MTYTLPQHKQNLNSSSASPFQCEEQNSRCLDEAVSPVKTIFSLPDTTFSEGGQQINHIFQSLKHESEVARQGYFVEEPDELVPDYTYIERACALAAKAPGMVLSEEQSKTFIGLRDISYTIDEDY